MGGVIEFSNSTNWQSQGDGKVNISNGKCNFNNVYEGNYNRIYKELGCNLFDSYWKSECDFSINSTNPSGYGCSAIVMALTSGDLNFISDVYGETDQDGIAVTFGSGSQSDNNINNWYFCIQSKKGNLRTVSTTKIYANTSTSCYFIRMERINSGTVELSIFSDSTLTTHLSGSPISFSINSSITGLNTVQHGVNEGGSTSRLINAKIDNDFICEKSYADIDEHYKFNLLVYPNPVIDKLTVECSINSTIEIFNIEGLIIKTSEIKNSDKTTIDLTDFSIGIYLMRVKTKEEIIVFKIKKE